MTNEDPNSIEFKVSRITVQKDEYETADDGKIGQTVFWKSDKNEAEVLQFKRAIAECKIINGDIEVEFQIIISLRGGFARVRLLDDPDEYGAVNIAHILQVIFSNFHHRPGFDSGGAFSPFGSRKSEKYMLCKVYDPDWVAATLHEIKDEKGYSLPIPETDNES